MHSSLPILLISVLPSLISALPASFGCVVSTTKTAGTLDTHFTLQALVPPTLDTWGVFLPPSDDHSVTDSPFISNDTTLKQTVFSLTNGSLTTVGVDGTTMHASSPPTSSSKTSDLVVIVFNIPIPEQYLLFSTGDSCDGAGKEYLELRPLPSGAQTRQFVVKSVKEGETIFEKPSDFDD
ncbi:hypothetical protein MMC22_009825, partial [Lobaria immixta]|nr:hypothetical protein [Lobaria immixta]